MTRVLFVDDDQNILDGLRRMLHHNRDVWDATFALGPLEAIECLDAEPVDVVVSDMRMPEMSGADLLEHVQKTRPGAARIILSGHSQRELAIRSAGIAHQFLAKPCDAETLRAAISRSLELRQLLANDGLRERVASLGALPNIPETYTRISKELSAEEPSLKLIAEVIEHDAAVTAKILQLVNSAFFGIAREIDSVEQAVTMLGIDVIESLTLSSSAFQAFAPRSKRFSEDTLWRRSQEVARMATLIADLEGLGKTVRAKVIQSAMLHDIGQLILATLLAEQYDTVLERAEDDPNELCAYEEACLGCNHGQIGAYLLGLWGLPDDIVKAAAYHHGPHLSKAQGLSPLALIYVANSILQAANRSTAELDISMEYLDSIGCSSKLESWRQATTATN